MTAFPFDIVAFDLDGTLADTIPDIAGGINRMLADFGRAPLTEAEVRPLIGDGARNLLRRVMEATGGSTEALRDEAHPLYLDHYAAHICDGTRPFPGVEEARGAEPARAHRHRSRKAGLAQPARCRR